MSGLWKSYYDLSFLYVVRVVFEGTLLCMTQAISGTKMVCRLYIRQAKACPPNLFKRFVVVSVWGPYCDVHKYGILFFEYHYKPQRNSALRFNRIQIAE